MDKKNTIIEFVKDHKKEIAIAGVTGIIGAAVGFLGHKRYISKNYGELLAAVRHLKYSNLDDGVTCAQHISWVLENANAMYWRIPQDTLTVGDVLSEAAITKMMELGDKPDMEITGFLVGVK